MGKLVDTLKKVTGKNRIPYNYKVGEKSSSSLPFDVKLSIDSDFKKAVTKWVTIGSIGIAAGIAAGIVISKNKRSW